MSLFLQISKICSKLPERLENWRSRRYLSLLYPAVNWKQAEAAVFVDAGCRGPTSINIWIERDKTGFVLFKNRELKGRISVARPGESVTEHQLRHFVEMLGALKPIAYKAAPWGTVHPRGGCLVFWWRTEPSTVYSIVAGNPGFQTAVSGVSAFEFSFGS